MRSFNEWMSFRTNNAQENNSQYEFVGTYDPDTIPDLTENSDMVDVGVALDKIPDSYKTQFSQTQNLMAGKSVNEDSKEVLWITVKDNNLTYIFEKTV
jgi:hypothetical protein